MARRPKATTVSATTPATTPAVRPAVAPAPATAPSPHQAAFTASNAPRRPDTPILWGDAAEDPDDYAQLWKEMAAWYQVVGPVEHALLDRVVSLTWRLRRVPRVERGIVTRATVGMTYRRAVTRVVQARDEAPLAQMESTGMLSTTRSATALAAVQALRGLRELLDAAPKVPFTLGEIVPIIVRVFGKDSRTDIGIYGLGDRLAMVVSMFHASMEGRGPEGVSRQQLKTAALALCNQIIATFQGLHDELAHDERLQDEAAAQALALPPAADRKGLAAYERHLHDSLHDATEQLRQAIARRRLAEVGRRAGLGWS